MQPKTASDVRLKGGASMVDAKDVKSNGAREWFGT